MMRSTLWPLLAVCSLLGFFPGCPAQGIGDPCTPEDEYSETFSGFSVSEVNTESRSFQCQSRLCLVNHFQGRVSCPYGQREGDGRCRLPGSEDVVTVAVPAQLVERRAADAVYCSCRCEGPDASARYCECPSGFSCTKVVPELSLGQAQLPGKYCIRAGTEYFDANIDKSNRCDPQLANCEAE
jgi:hypothetical protein